MRSAWKRRSNAARHASRESSGSRDTARAPSSTSSHKNPVTPSSTISGTDPRGNAMTGVPHASASIITMPNGSGQSMGKRSARAPPRSSCLPASPISPTNSTSGSERSGATW